jgi:arylsulfatase
MRATGSLVTAGVLSVALLVSPAAGATDLLGAIRAHADHAETPLVAWRPVSTHGRLRQALFSPVPYAADLPVAIPPAGRLRFGIAVLDHWFTTNVLDVVRPVRFAVTFTDEAGERTTLLTRTLDIRSRPGDRRWVDYDLDLAALGGRQGTLRLATTFADATQTGDAFALWSRPMLYGADPAGTPQVDLLLITIDALRADHVGSAGYERDTTPALDRLAAEGVRFARAFTNAPMTFPSLPQILTSAHYPTLVSPTVATSLYAGGFRHTKAIVHNPYLEIWLQYLARDSFDSVLAVKWDATRISRAAMEWIDSRGDERWALYLHYLDTHTPYGVPEPHASRFVDPSYRGSIGRRFPDIEGAKAGRYGPADRAHVVDLYDGAIAYVDAEIGRILDGLRARGRLDRTLVVVTADHGEEFWDHGSFFHGGSLYDEQLHVPLLMRLPGGEPRGVTVDAQVPTLDVLPTIADVLGVPTESGVEGRSLMPLVRGEESADRPVFARASNVLFIQRHALRTGSHKLIETLHPHALQLFDLVRDPEERHDLAGDPTQAGRVRELRAALQRHRAVLADVGFQVRVVTPADAHPDVRVVVTRRAGSEIQMPDWVGPPAGTLRLNRWGKRVAWRARTEPGVAGMRFDRGASSSLFADTPLHVDIRIDGAPARPEDVWLGQHGTHPDTVPFTYEVTQPPGTLAVERPALSAERAPALAAPAGGRVGVHLWRTLSPGPITTGALPVDARARERLRALGYVE